MLVFISKPKYMDILLYRNILEILIWFKRLVDLIGKLAFLKRKSWFLYPQDCHPEADDMIRTVRSQTQLTALYAPKLRSCLLTNFYFIGYLLGSGSFGVGYTRRRNVQH